MTDMIDVPELPDDELDDLPFTDDDDDYDTCYECRGYGDDYWINDDGELECRCDDCPFNGRDNDK